MGNDDRVFLREVRCPGSKDRECGKLLLRAFLRDAVIELKCPRCGGHQVYGVGQAMFQYLDKSGKLPPSK